MEENKINTVDKSKNYKSFWKNITSNQQEFPGEKRINIDLQGLTPREEKVLSMRYGLGEYNKCHSSAEVFAALNDGLLFDSEQRICEIETKAIGKMRIRAMMTPKEIVDQNLEEIKANIHNGEVIDIGHIGLSVRTFVALKRAGFNTLDELLNTTESYISRVRGLAKNGPEEIKLALENLGLSLKSEDLEVQK